jgi:hypothetical protein
VTDNVVAWRHHSATNRQSSGKHLCSRLRGESGRASQCNLGKLLDDRPLCAAGDGRHAWGAKGRPCRPAQPPPLPEAAAGLAGLKAARFVMDGELVIPGQSFETSQLRLRPAASRIAELSGKLPARLVVFDVLADDSG